MKSLVIWSVLAACVGALFYSLSVIKAERSAEAKEQKRLLNQEAEAAKKDSDAIVAGIRAFSAHKKHLDQLENDRFLLRTAEIGWQMAGLERRPRNRDAISKYTATVRQDESLVESDQMPSPVQPLSLRKADERINIHNQTFPHFTMSAAESYQ